MKKDPGNSLKKSQKINLGESSFTFKNKVDKKDREDIFRFRVRSSFDLNIDLSQLSGNADLELYSLKGKRGEVLKDIGRVDFNTLKRKDIRQNLKRVARSNNKGKNSETIQQRIEPGQYYLRVLSKKGAKAKYRLRISATEPTFQQVWVDQFGSAEDDQALAIVSSNTDQGIYLAGTTGGVFLEPIQNPTKKSDAFVTKYTSDGSVDWFNTVGGADRDGLLHLKLDNKGNIYGLGNTNYTPPIGFDTIKSDPYFVKYNSRGDLLFEDAVEGADPEIGMGLSINSSGNILAITQRASVSPDLSSETTQLIYQYTSSGGVQFQSTLDSVSQNLLIPSTEPFRFPTEAFSDKDGNLYLIGGVINPLPAGGQSNLESAFDGFVAKYDASGRKLWQNSISSPDADIVGKIAVDNSGNVYVVGSTVGSLPGQSSQGQDDAFLAKYSANGTSLWVRQFGTSKADEALDVAVGGDGNIYVVGSNTGDLFGHKSLGERDSWLAQWDANGNVLDSVQIGTPEDDLATRLTIDANGDIYVAGITEGNLGGENQGGIDAWIAKYTPPA